MSEEVGPLQRDHLLCMVLPGGQEKSVTVHGRWVISQFKKINNCCNSNDFHKVQNMLK